MKDAPRSGFPSMSQLWSNGQLRTIFSFPERGDRVSTVSHLFSLNTLDY